MAAAYQAIVAEAEAGINLASSAYETVKKGYQVMSNIVTPITQSSTSRKRQATEASIALNHSQGSRHVAEPHMTSMVPAQVIMGRGAELPYTAMNYAKAIKFKTGEISRVGYEDPFKHFSKLFKSNMNVSMGFAFKMILAPSPLGFMLTASGQPWVPIPTRFCVHNIFRHNIMQVTNTDFSTRTSIFGSQHTTWNKTLGPDGSFVRQNGSDVVLPIVAGAGTAYNITGTGTTTLNANFVSPYRHPLNNGFMYSRLNRQTLENLGWNANPFKFASIIPNSNTLAYTNFQVLGNGTVDTTGSGPSTSLPHQAVFNAVTGEAAGTTSPWRYRSQMGVGGLVYHFHNDGSNPVVVDVVITRIKKGESWNVYSSETNLRDAYNAGYNNYLSNNRGQVSMNGERPFDYDCMTNARVPFMPELALKYYKTPGTANQSPHPFKQVGRDQFILPSGGSRSWSMDLAAANYPAYEYDQNLHGFDDLSYCVSLAVSGVPVPILEQNTAIVNPPVVDRRGDSCNVSVQGTYNEKPFPVYPVNTITRTFINGVTDTPYYQSNAPSSQKNPAVDIASTAQATRSNSLATAYIELGPTTVLP